MARSRTIPLTLAGLTLALTGCATGAEAGARASWQSKAGVPGAGGGTTQPTVAARGTHKPRVPDDVDRPSPSATPSSSPTQVPKPDPTTNSPTPPPSASPNAPEKIFTTGSSTVALTFDDGPGPFTAPLLDLLAQYHVKATFCLIGQQVHAYADLVRRMVAEGHTLCNHTWSHDLRLRTRGDDQIRADLQRTNDAIHAVVPDAKIVYFRNPGGNFGPNTVSVAASLGMKSIMWSVDPRDWAKPGTQAIIDRVVGHTGSGSIVLSHDGGGDRSQTLAAYRVIIPNLKARLTLVALPIE